MSKLPSLASAILHREVQGSSCSKKIKKKSDGIFAVMSDIIRGPKAPQKKRP